MVQGRAYILVPFGNGWNGFRQRALQDWYVKFALQTVPGVAEVASFGGFEKQYQLVLDPLKIL
jgi:Cu(I)/Ag(I) efflux system membrane protein CusA/SilA